MLRRSNNNQGSGEASDFMEVDMSRKNSQQSGFDGFSGNFGDFDEGYYDNNQNLGQGRDGYGYGNQRYRNNYKQGSYGGRGRGGRYGSGRGRFNRGGGHFGTPANNSVDKECSSSARDQAGAVLALGQ
jgi:hypothetical protein